MKKNISKYAALAVAAALMLTGCNELERMPYNEIPADKMDTENIESITRGTYAKLKEESYYKVLHQVGEYGGDNVSLSGGTSDQLFKIYTYSRVNDNSYERYFWQISYKAVVNTNSMIELIPEGESAEKDQLLGENYFLRGFLYFNLVNIYGRPYAQSPETNPGVPLKLTTKLDDIPQRATVKETYAQIVSDMEKAAQLMTIRKSNINASKEVAQAYLSRIYLYMGEWQKAIDNANAVISSGRYNLLRGLAYQNYTNGVPESNSETIFAIRMNKDVDFKKYSMGWYSVGSLYAKIDNVGWGEMYPSSTYLELLDKHPEDLRHGFIKGATLGVSFVDDEGNADDDDDTSGPYTWLRYINEDDMVYVTRKVVLNGGDYVIDSTADEKDNPEDFMFTTPTVQKEGDRYYITENESGQKYYVVIEDAVKLRNGYPRWFIYKCSMQEGQSHLYSPVMIRLAEVYLNRAEAEYQLRGGGLDDVNVIRSRAGIPLLGGVTLNDILDERRLELAWEGQRKYDVFRNGLTLDRNYPGTHPHVEIDPDDDVIVELLPQKEVDAYPIALIPNP